MNGQVLQGRRINVSIARNRKRKSSDQPVPRDRRQRVNDGESSVACVLACLISLAVSVWFICVSVEGLQHYSQSSSQPDPVVGACSPPQMPATSKSNAGSVLTCFIIIYNLTCL